MSERSDQHNSTSPPRHGLSCSEAHSETGIFVKPIESATRGASMVGRSASHAAHVGRAIGPGSGSHARANGPLGFTDRAESLQRRYPEGVTNGTWRTQASSRCWQRVSAD